MIKTKCQWCSRPVQVDNWIPVTNREMKFKPFICRSCHISYEAGFLKMLMDFNRDKDVLGALMRGQEA